MSSAYSESKTSGKQRPVFALLEASENGELARLLADHGGAVAALPTVSEALFDEVEAVRRLLDELAAGRHPVVIFTTGTAVSSLFEISQELGRRAELVAALRRATTACRGPKAAAVLRAFGLTSTLGAGAPLTTARLIHSLGRLELAGRAVLRFNGDPEDALAEKLRAQRANVREIWLYQRRSPNDVEPFEDLVRRIVGRRVDALIVTCDVQYRHLYQVARSIDLERGLVSALRKDVVVATVSASCQEIIEAHGVRPQMLPAQPQLLVPALMRFLDKREGAPLCDAQLAAL